MSSRGYISRGHKLLSAGRTKQTKQQASIQINSPRTHLLGMTNKHIFEYQIWNDPNEIKWYGAFRDEVNNSLPQSVQWESDTNGE